MPNGSITISCIVLDLVIVPPKTPDPIRIPPSELINPLTSKFLASCNDVSDVASPFDVVTTFNLLINILDALISTLPLLHKSIILSLLAVDNLNLASLLLVPARSLEPVKI